MRIYAPRRPTGALAVMQQQEETEQKQAQLCSPAAAADAVMDVAASVSSSSSSLPFVVLNVFAACLSDPIQPGLLQLLSWQVQRDSLAAVPQLQLLLQAATLHHLFSTDITAFIHTQTAPSSSPLSSPPPALLPLVSRLSDYITQLEACCRPAACSGLAARLCLQLRHQLVVRYLSGVEAVSREFIQELVQLLFPRQEQRVQRPAASEQEEKQRETGRRLRRLLLDKGQSTAEYVDSHPYTALQQQWQTLYSSCRATRAFADVDQHILAFCAPLFSSSQRQQQQARAAAAQPAAPAAASPDTAPPDGLQAASPPPLPAASSPPPSPPLASPQKQPGPAADSAPSPAAAAGAAAVAAVGSCSPSPCSADSRSSPIVLPNARLSCAELLSLLRSARAGVAEARVSEEWDSIVDGTHPDIVQWRRQTEAERRRQRRAGSTEPQLQRDAAGDDSD